MRFFFLSVFIFVAQFSKAQVATINSQEIFDSMPVFKKIDTLSLIEKEKYVKEITQMQGNYQLLYVYYDSLSKIKPTPQSIPQLRDSVQRMELTIRQYDQEAVKRVNEYRNILQKPYLDKVQQAIEKVAKQRKMAQVVDKQLFTFAYASDEFDLTKLVIKELSLSNSSEQANTNK